MRCLEQAEIDRYVAGTMDPLAADQISQHLTACRRCRRLVADCRGRGSTEAADGEPQQADPPAERVAEEAEREERPERHEKPDHRAVVKAQCTACKARYGIPEDRVKGRVLKIRCKSCGGIIEVRGPETTSRSVLDRGRRLWFVVIQRQRVGPMTEQELRERFDRGEVKARTYAWRQGFQRWERLFAIAELKDLVESTPPAEPPSSLVRPKRTTRPLPELATQPGAHESDTQPGIHEIPTRPGIHEIATRVGDSERAEPTKPAKRRRTEPQPAVEPSGSGELNFDAPGAIRTSHAAAGDTADKQPLEPVTTEQSAVGGPSTDERLTHIHFKERDPLAGLEVPAPAEESVAGDEDEKGTAILPRESMEAEEESTLSAGDFERHMRGQRSDNSVLFSLAHLRKLAAPQAPSTKRSTGWTGLFDIRPLAAPPPPLIAPIEPPPPRRIGFGVVMGIGFCGVIIGAATLLGVLYLTRPDGLKQLLQPGPRTLAKAPAEVRTAPPQAGTGAAAVAAPRPDARREMRAVVAVRDAGPALSKKAEAKQEKVETKPEKAAKVETKPEKVAKVETKPEKAAKVEKKQVEAKVKVAASDTKPASDGPPKKAPRRRPKAEIKVVDPEAAVPPDGSAVAKKSEKKRPEKKRSEDDQEEIDRLVDAATEGKPPEGKTEEGGADDKPKPKAKTAKKDSDAEKPQITREQVAAGMRQAHGGVQACNEKYEQTGMVSIEATIDGRTGRISTARVVGSFAGTPVGNCVLEAAKRMARFPKFTGPALTLEYPFILR